MTKTIYLLFSLLFLLACGHSGESVPDNPEPTASTGEKENFGIVLHGGAGTILKEHTSDSVEKAYREKLAEGISMGHEILKNGGTALEAVTRTIMVMEDSPLFNSGKGAVFTHEGKNELDASIMDGSNLNAGAVAGVQHIKNPIKLAKDVMQQSNHVMLYGAG